MTSAKAIDQNALGITVSGLAVFSAATGNIALTAANAVNSINEAGFNTPANVAFTNGGATQLYLSDIGGSFSLISTGAITQAVSVEVDKTFSINCAGSITLDDPFNAISTLGSVARGGDFKLIDTGALTISGAVTAGGMGNNVTIATTGGDLTIAASAPVIAGEDVTLSTDSGFINKAGSKAISINSGGGYLIYSSAPSFTVSGGLAFNFHEFNDSYPDVPLPGNIGNGIIYASPQD